MGLLLGSFPDEYTTHVVDVVAMPQRGTGVSVEAIDHVFQTDMLDMRKQTQRHEMVVGWYHSHPGFGCWLYGVDMTTQQGFEALNRRAVAVVVDPIQSVKGKALIHGLNRNYYSLAVNFRMNGVEEKMLLNLHKKKWTDGLTMRQFDAHSKTSEQTLQKMSNLAIKYNNALQEDGDAQPEKLAIANVGRADAKKHLEEHVYNMMSSNIAQTTLGTVLDTVAF
ncbi:26S proteasome non-ATPase regulatory subunit 14 homolog [Prunus persica]|uniref:26S proteasome non-ATPase regulatory subunit 14 homolog n=1 Tax=Prunus persica TaxID=3760 RepID=UPI0009AB41A2|nr:26S proteasome non-ATPase regulatory subunit 14 homolog [Prunus persica]XP_020419103.1 26S proteasome non-ATPase regulatory subunit 14 homolog [Prunus persica]